MLKKQLKSKNNTIKKRFASRAVSQSNMLLQTSIELHLETFTSEHASILKNLDGVSIVYLPKETTN